MGYVALQSVSKCWSTCPIAVNQETVNIHDPAASHRQPGGGGGVCSWPAGSACMTYMAARWGGRCSSAARAPSPCSCAMHTPASSHTLRGERRRWQHGMRGRKGVTPTTRRRHTPSWPRQALPAAAAQPVRLQDRHQNTAADSSQCSHARPSTRRRVKSKLTAQWWLHPRPQRRPPARRHARAPPPRFAAPQQGRCCAWPVATESCQSGWRLEEQGWGGGGRRVRRCRGGAEGHAVPNLAHAQPIHTTQSTEPHHLRRLLHRRPPGWSRRTP